MPNLNIIICDRGHAEMAINTLLHRLAPTVGETIVAMPGGHDVGTRSPAAIGITADHKLIATYNLGPSPEGDRNLVCFFNVAGELSRVERHPSGGWDIPESVITAARGGAEAVIKNFIDEIGRITNEGQQPSIPPPEPENDELDLSI